MNCPACSNPLTGNESFCGNCGGKISFCSCGAANEIAAKFCGSCGLSLQSVPRHIPSPPAAATAPPATFVRPMTPTALRDPIKVGGGYQCPNCKEPLGPGTITCPKCRALLSFAVPFAPPPTMAAQSAHPSPPVPRKGLTRATGVAVAVAVILVAVVIGGWLVARAGIFGLKVASPDLVVPPSTSQSAERPDTSAHLLGRYYFQGLTGMSPDPSDPENGKYLYFNSDGTYEGDSQLLSGTYRVIQSQVVLKNALGETYSPFWLKEDGTVLQSSVWTYRKG